MENENGYWTSMRIKNQTLNRLKEWGEFGECYDDVINKVLDMMGKRKK